MADEFKSMRENLFKILSGFSVTVASDDQDSDDQAVDSEKNSAQERGPNRSNTEARAARALLAALFTKAGKGKDELVQIIAREIGVAFAHMLKEPLSQLAKQQKLQISLEFVPKNKPPSDPPAVTEPITTEYAHGRRRQKNPSSPGYKAAKSRRS